MFSLNGCPGTGCMGNNKEREVQLNFFVSQLAQWRTQTKTGNHKRSGINFHCWEFWMKIRRSLIWGIAPEIFCLGMKETSQRMFSRANRIPGGSPSSSNPLLSTLSAPWNLFASCHLRVQPKSIPTTSLFLAHPLVLLLHNIHKTTIRWLTRVQLSQAIKFLVFAIFDQGPGGLRGGVGGLSKNKKWHNPMTQWWLSGRVEHSKEATIKGCLASLEAFKFQRPGFVTRCHFSSPEQLS